MATTTFNKKSLGLEAPEAPTPGESQTTFVKKPKLAGAKSRKRDIPEGLWTKCNKCGNMIYDKELDANLKVCPKCQFHFPLGARLYAMRPMQILDTDGAAVLEQYAANMRVACDGQVAA